MGFTMKVKQTVKTEQPTYSCAHSSSCNICSVQRFTLARGCIAHWWQLDSKLIATLWTLTRVILSSPCLIPIFILLILPWITVIHITNLPCVHTSFVGLLDAVSNLRSASLGQVIRLTWDAPFSLDITGVDPDIWYRVDITVADDPLSTCNEISIPEVNFTMDNDTSLSVVYEFSVTSMNGAGNGARSYSVIGYFTGRELLSTWATSVITSTVLPTMKHVVVLYV